MKKIRCQQGIGLCILAFLILLTGLPAQTANAYPGTFFKDAAVVARQQPSGNWQTLFWASISGPSPEDITSFQVIGPGATIYILSPFLSDRTRGLGYLLIDASVVPDGNYTFEVTDTMGRVTSIVKSFTHNDSIPQVDIATMSAAEGYIGTTTPTLSFTAIPGNWYYNVYVFDSANKATWYKSAISQDTSYTVPAGLLQPDTPYYWLVRVYDSDTAPMNCHDSETKTFYTSTNAAPDLSNVFITSYEGTGYGGMYFGIRETNIAFWDLDGDGYIKVISPNATEYNLTWWGLYFSKPMYYFFQTSTNFPLPDGTYTVKMKPDGGSEVSTTLNYTRKPLPVIDESKMFPVNNTYFNGPALKFSWAPLPGGPFYYRVRVHDYVGRIQWYDTDPENITSISIPIKGNFVRGTSYKWDLLVYDDVSNPNNMTASSRRTFSINRIGGSSGPAVRLLLLDQ